MTRAIPTQYGFKWGAGEISRLCDHNGHVTMQVKTPLAAIDIRITPSGMVRIDQTDGRPSTVRIDAAKDANND